MEWSAPAASRAVTPETLRDFGTLKNLQIRGNLVIQFSTHFSGWVSGIIPKDRPPSLGLYYPTTYRVCEYCTYRRTLVASATAFAFD